MQGQVISVFCFILLLSCVFSQKSTEKCKEYSKLPHGKIEVNKTPGGGPLGKGPTNPGEFPHMAILQYGPPEKRLGLCGGALISENYVLTAAQCSKEPNLGAPQVVYLGAYNTKSLKDNENVQEFKIAEIIPHPDFKKPFKYNDIMLLKLDGKVKFTNYVRPACLYTSVDLPSNPLLSAIGWGLEEYGGSTSDTLKKVYLDVFTKEECNDAYKSTSKRTLKTGINHEQMICLGGKGTPKDTCQGDSGGPVQMLNEEQNMYDILGITSFGRACGLPDVPGVYTRVVAYLPWIQSIVWP